VKAETLSRRRHLVTVEVPLTDVDKLRVIAERDDHTISQLVRRGIRHVIAEKSETVTGGGTPATSETVTPAKVTASKTHAGRDSNQGSAPPRRGDPTAPPHIAGAS
jgi:hypothetical protein